MKNHGVSFNKDLQVFSSLADHPSLSTEERDKMFHLVNTVTTVDNIVREIFKK